MRPESASGWRALMAPATLACATPLFFGAASLYVHNAPEFVAPGWRLLAWCGLETSLLIAIILTVGALCPGRYRPALIQGVFASGLLLWAQGNLLVWDYGPMDGQPIDWAAHAWPNSLDIVLWAVVLSVALFRFRPSRQLRNMVSAGLLMMQALSFAFIQKAPTIGGVGEARPGDPAVFSGKRDVLHVIMDTFQADVFGELVEEENWGDRLEGFVWFRNHLGAFPSTYMSIPAIFSGQIFDNRGSPAEFFRRALSDSAFYNSLHDAGFDVHLTPSWPVYPCLGAFTTCRTIPEPYDSPERVPLREALLLTDLSLFRHAPHLLKRFVHNDQKWVLQGLLAGERPPGVFFNHLAFLDDYRSRIRGGGDQPSYHLLHLLPPHFPLVADRNCQYIGAQPLSRSAYKEQAGCALRMFLDLLDDLRERGLYDSTLIVLQSDHGAGRLVQLRNVETAAAGGPSMEVLQEYLAGAALALLAVKPPGGSGALTSSSTPTTIGDIGPTVLAGVQVARPNGAPSVFDIEPGRPRMRLFNAYVWRHQKWQADSLGPIQQYEVDGDVYDALAWRLGSVLMGQLPPHSGREIDFGTPGAAYALARGWAADERLADGTTVAWALGNSAAVAVSLPLNEAVRLRARLLAFPRPGTPQRIGVRIDGTSAGVWDVPETDWKFREYEIYLKADAERPDSSLVELWFRYSSASDPERPDGRPLAALFDWIRVEPADARSNSER